MVTEGKPKKIERQDSLVQNVTWRHYMFFVIHMLQSVASSIGQPVLTQYLYAKIKNEYFIAHNISNNGSHQRLGRCFTNVTSPGYKLQQEVQSINAEWMQWFSLCSGIPSIIVIFIAASWIDVLGRKVVVIINMTGHMLRYLMYCLVMNLELKTAYLLCGYVIEGVVGGHLLNIIVTYAYTADITPRNKKRGFLLVVVHGITHICYGLAHLGSGYFIRETGFSWPLVFAICLSGVLIVLFIFMVPETMPRGKLSELSLKKSARRVTMFYTSSKTKSGSQRLKFWLCLLAFASLSQSVIGEFGLEILYELNAPFCWDSVQLGYYGAAMSIGIPMLSILTLKIMQMFLSEPLIGVTSLIFFILRSLIRAFATKTWMLYLSGLVGAPGLLSFAMIRTIVSQLSDATEQGSVFAGLGTVEAICGMTSSLMLNSIYAHTLLWMKGFVFVVVAICCIAPASLLLALHFVIKKEQKEQGEVTVNTVEMECKDGTPSTSQSNNEDGMKHGKVEEERKESEYDKTTKGEYNLGYTN